MPGEGTGKENAVQGDDGGELRGEALNEVKIVSLAAGRADKDKFAYEDKCQKEDGKVKAELKIEGMMCQHCQKHVHDALSKMAGVVSVEVDLEKKTATVESDREIPVDEFRSVIAEAGYELV